jgi:hypothetical protein
MKGMDVAMLWLNERSEEVRKIGGRQQQLKREARPLLRVWPGFA